MNNESTIIDNTRLLLFCFVILLHTNLVTDTASEVTPYGMMYDMARHVLALCNPLFFAISGYLFFKGGEMTTERFRQKMSRRWHSLVLPYITWNTIYIIIFVMFLLIIPAAVSASIETLDHWNLLYVLRCYFNVYGEGLSSTPIDSPLWFLRNLIILSVLSPVIYRILRLHPLAITVFVVTDILLDANVFMMFALGGAASIWQWDVLGWVRKWWRVCAAVFFTFVMILDIENVLTQSAGVVAVLALMCYISNRREQQGGDSRTGIMLPSRSALFFIYCSHGIVARLLTKGTASVIIRFMATAGDGTVAPDSGAQAVTQIAMPLLHITNGVITFGICWTMYHAVTRFVPSLSYFLGTER